MKLPNMREILYYESAKSSDQEWLKTFPRAADHRWQHTLSVVANAAEILSGEDAAEEVVAVVRVAALMHDISMFACDHSIHGRASADMARDDLTGKNFSLDFVERVSTAIAEHGTGGLQEEVVEVEMPQWSTVE
jgi:HD superfamily phosphodiesterase